MHSPPGVLTRLFRSRLRAIHLSILAVLCISLTWIVATLWLPESKSSVVVEKQLEADILRLSLEYVRLLAHAQRNTIDGPYHSSGTNYDMKKTMAVLLNDMNRRIDKLDDRVKDLSSHILDAHIVTRSSAGSHTQRRLHQTHASVLPGASKLVDFAALLSGVQENCVVSARKMFAFPECQSKMEWLRKRWPSDPCYSELGVDGTDCSLIRYLSEVENFCPAIEGLVKESDNSVAQITYNLDGLLSRLQPEERHHDSFEFIRSRLVRMWPLWVDGMKRYASWNMDDKGVTTAKQFSNGITGSCGVLGQPVNRPIFFNRTRLKVHLHLSFISFSSSAAFEDSIGKGGPLGELVQWTDLLAGLYLLGHDVSVSIETRVLLKLLNFSPSKKSECQTEQNVFDLLFTDIVGYKRLKAMGVRIPKCKYRILDSFGTEAIFNQDTSRTVWGGLQMNLKQFYTMFPHSADNTFLGFVVETMSKLQENGTDVNENCTVHGNVDKPVALVYGKEAYMWKDALPYLRVLNESFELHANVMDTPLNASFAFVHKHQCHHGVEFTSLVRSSKVFVGLGFPYEGPAPLEAIANGVIFINPRFQAPHWRNNTKFFADKPTMRKLTSQHPYLEQYVGEPYSYLVNMDNPAQIRQTIRRLLTQPKVSPFVPFEYTTTGFIERLNALLNRQSFCTAPERLGLLHTPWRLNSFGTSDQYLDLDANVIHWPPLNTGDVQFILGSANASCVEVCAAAPRPENISHTDSIYLQKRAKVIPTSTYLSELANSHMYCSPEHFTSVNHHRLIEIHPEVKHCNDIHWEANPTAPYWNPTERLCVLQANRLFFDCTAKPSGPYPVRRLCPCRTGLLGQVTLCANCV